ncbi:hypothetical protein CMZ80_14975 [Lysobacteraceae bacterium NML93-0831]|nr:hypothetical protein CMZ80_14975 [Xanthomonadaceae bacterium NML93-0831]
MPPQAATRPRRGPAAWPLLTLLPLVLWLGACQRAPADAPEPDPVTGGATPAEAVSSLTAHLRSGDLAAFAHDAVPPALAPALDQAWREGRSRWPLTELPLSGQIPAVLAALSAPQAERTLLQAFNRQFAGADRELRSAAIALGVFAAQYLEHDGAFSDGERAHYTQLVAAISDWAAQAPLSDRERARAAITALVEASRQGGVGDDARLGQAGMPAGLTALSPVFSAAKQQLRAYGLDLDMAFDSLEVSLLEQTGDTARVRMRYLLAGRPVDAVVAVERVAGRWYVTDFLRHARAAAAVPPADAGPGGS